MSFPLEKYNPLRRVDWRYERVVKLLDRPSGRPLLCRWWDDDETRRLRAYLLEHRRCQDDEDLERLLRKFPALYYAHLMHISPVDELTPHFIQARILARQSDKQIAHHYCTFPQVVQWYEAAFFHVRDRLHARDWIVRQILGRMEAIERTQVGIGAGYLTSLKLFGYFAGPVILDAIISGFTHDRGPEDIKEVGEFYTDCFTNTIMAKACLAARSLRIDADNVMQLLGLCMKLVEIQKFAKEGEGAYTTIEQNIHALLLEIHPLVGGRQGRDNEPQDLIDVDAGPYELRDHQLQQIASGLMPASVVELKLLEEPYRRLRHEPQQNR